MTERPTIAAITIAALARVPLLMFWALWLVSPVEAQERWIIGVMKSLDPNAISALSGECDLSRDRMVLTCKLIEYNLRPPTKDLASLEAEQSKSLTSQGVQALLRSTCTRDIRQRAEARLKEALSPAARAHVADFVQRLREFCERPSVNSMKTLLRKMTEDEAKTCKIWAHPFEQTFKKNAGGNWVSNTGPDGLCGSIDVSTLTPAGESMPGVGPVIWRYESRRIYTNKTGALCEKFSDGVEKFSWNSPPKVQLCEIFEFGP